MTAKKTMLYDAHVEAGARLVEFAGWMMPVQYRGLKEEHLNVRSNVGLFDVSHMGEIFVTGDKSLETLQWLTSNDVSVLNPGEAQYSLLTNFEGGIVDDLIVYCIEKGARYLLCVNAANIEKDYNWICENNKGADLSNDSDQWSQIAVQGPKAMDLIGQLDWSDLKELKPFCFQVTKFKGVEAIVAKTGYTGEDGVEIFIKNKGAVGLWQALLTQGKNLSVEPIGLGARDTLRTEMKYSLYGHEISDSTNPLEAGLGWVTKLGAKEFIGSDKISNIKAAGIERKLIGFKMLDNGIARQGYPLLNADGQVIGEVTSGSPSPSLDENIGIGYMPKNNADIGSEFLVQVRSRQLKAVVVKTPFVNQKG